MDQRKEFVLLASQEGANISDLCRRYGISRKTGYKWLGRHEAGEKEMADRPRRPKTSPRRTKGATEALVLALRERHPQWGGRKLRAKLKSQGHKVPAASTITAILHRHGQILQEASHHATPFKRFEHAHPNDLWQMDFKGHFPLAQQPCHPLTVLDDHSRFNILLEACANQQTQTVKASLIKAFRCYGLPWRITMDNGSPWGSFEDHGLTPLTVWMILLGIRISHSRPYHPQTQGKDERFHRTLKAELLQSRSFQDIDACKAAFAQYRMHYNTQRPHQALDFNVPASRYHPSPRPFPERLPDITYAPDDHVRKVSHAHVSFKGLALKLPKALNGYPVALRQTSIDETFDVFFCTHKIKSIDIKTLKNIT